jgi:hypothetical protein
MHVATANYQQQARRRANPRIDGRAQERYDRTNQTRHYQLEVVDSHASLLLTLLCSSLSEKKGKKKHQGESKVREVRREESGTTERLSFLEAR